MNKKFMIKHCISLFFRKILIKLFLFHKKTSPGVLRIALRKLKIRILMLFFVVLFLILEKPPEKPINEEKI